MSRAPRGLPRALASGLERANTEPPVEAERVDYIGAAAFIGVPIGTVRAWVARRQIPHLRLGPRLVRFDLADLRRWLDERRVEAEGRPA